MDAPALTPPASLEPQRVALVTGGSSGLGAAMVEAFREAGWGVVAASRHPPEARPGVHPLAMDVTDSGSVTRGFSEITERWGRMDALVNNAGITADRLLGNLTEADWDAVLDVSLRGAFLCARAALPLMVRQRAGHIVNIASFSGRYGNRGQANYAAAKAALLGMTLALAREMGPENVQVNAVLPGFLRTAMTSGLPAEVVENATRMNALGRLGTVEEVARFVVFLTTMQHVSGQVFQLDSRILPWT